MNRKPLAYRCFATVTRWSESLRLRVETRTELSRPYPLTRVGTERILNRDRQGERLSVVSIECLRVCAAVMLALLLSSSARAQEPCKVNLNAATPAQIALLIRTGPVLAARIVEARPLDAVKLDAVKGVGEAWMSNNGPHVTFAGPTTCTEKLKAPKPAAKQ